MTIMAHTIITSLKGKFEDGDRPTGEDFKNLLDSCHNTKQDTAVTITGSLTVSGSSILKSTLAVSDNITSEGNLTIDGSSLLKGTLNVYSNATVNKDLYVAEDARIHKDLQVDEGVSVTGDSVLTGSLDVHDNVTLHKTLNVTEGQHNSSTLIVDGASIFNDTLTLNGDVDVNSNLLVGMDLTVDGDATVDGAATFNGLITAKQGQLTTGNAVFNDSVHIKGDLRVDGNAYLSAGPGGDINVGDSNTDNVLIHADIASSITPNTTDTYNLGSSTATWAHIYATDLTVDSISIDGLIDGRDISEDGIALDSVYNTTATGSGDWKTGYEKSLVNESNITIVSVASTGWNQTEAVVNEKMARWDDTRSAVTAFSASWEESIDIQAVADDVAVVGAVSADWSDARTTLGANSAVWGIDKLVDFVDVNPAGLSNNSILRYDGASDTWVTSTTEDVRASGTVTVLDGNNSAWGGGTLTLVDNASPANTVTFTGDVSLEHGNVTKINNWSYTFGHSGVWNNSMAATVLANAINTATTDDDLSITAEAVADVVNLSQNVAGAAGNTSVTGDLLNMNLIGAADFTGGENPDAFEALDDTPASYGGQSGKFVKVNLAETGLEFIDDDTRTTVNTFSASWEESADIQEVADDVATVGAVSGNWNDARTTLTGTSGDWNDARTTLGATSGDWSDTRSSLQSASGDWNESQSVVNTTSGDWSDARSSLQSASGDWNESQSVVNTTSADWNDTRSSLQTASGDWNESQSVVNTTSADWSDARTTLGAASGDWNESQSVVNTTSADWSDARTTLGTTSGDWNDARTTLGTASGDWNESQSVVNTTSGDWNSVYTHIKAVSGAGIATLDNAGKLLTDQIPELSITRVHTANNPSDVELLNPTTGIQVGDVIVVMSTHDNLIALVDGPGGEYDNSTKDYTGYAKLAMPDGLVQTVNGKPGPSVVLNPDDFLDDLTAHKFVLQNQIDNWNDARTTLNTTSGDWSDTRTTLNATSGSWNDARTTLNTTSGDWSDARSSLQTASGDWNESQSVVNTSSGDWDESTTVVNNTSADWNDARSTLIASSGDWYDTRSSVMNTSGDWNSVYSWVNSDSATNNTGYNYTAFVNASGDTMTGNLDIDGGELTVGGNITMAGDLIHQNDTGTRVSFNDDVISLEANGQEFITIDGTAPTPDAVVINDPAAVAIHFKVKSPTDSNLLFVDATGDQVGIGTGVVTNGIKFEVAGDTKLQDVVAEDASAKNIAVTTGAMVSAGVDLLDIFSTDTDIHGDLTVHGSISSRDEIVVAKTATISGDLILGSNIELPNQKADLTGSLVITENLSGKTVTAEDSYHTIDGTGAVVAGVTQDVNIGGHVLHIVNGLIVKVTDE